MAATLPPIGGGNMKRGQVMHQQFVPSSPQGHPSGRLKPLKQPQGKLDRERLAKHERLRAEQESLNKKQTAIYRNTYKHNLCLDMLQDGFHKSFSELFALIKQQEEQRQQAGPESLMWTMAMLKDQHEKLNMLKLHLCRSEDAYRKGDYSDVYRARFELACYFQKTGDKWLSDHFFSTCLQVSTEVTDDGGKMQAEGFCNVGLAQEENGDYFDAAENFESYYKLSANNSDWLKVEDEMTFYTHSCINLCRIYTTIGNKMESEDADQAVRYFTKAHAMSKESMDRKLEGEAAYRLGLAFEKSGDGETALLHLNNFLDICNASSDSDGMGKACDAIAKAYARQGKVEESINYLKQYVDVSEKSGQEKAYSKACHNLGAIFNSLGRYDEATEYFSKAYNLSRALSDGSSINTNRVQFGIAMAHKMMGGIGNHIVLGSRPAMERLVEWKSSRTDEFDKPFPEPEPPKQPEPPPPPPPAPAKEEEEEEEKKEEETKEEDESKQEASTAATTEDTQSEATDS